MNLRDDKGLQVPGFRRTAASKSPVALRADMDAVPVKEPASLPFAPRPAALTRVRPSTSFALVVGTRAYCAARSLACQVQGLHNVENLK
jgi:hypothetical protein